MDLNLKTVNNLMGNLEKTEAILLDMIDDNKARIANAEHQMRNFNRLMHQFDLRLFELDRKTNSSLMEVKPANVNDQNEADEKLKVQQVTEQMKLLMDRMSIVEAQTTDMKLSSNIHEFIDKTMPSMG